MKFSLERARTEYHNDYCTVLEKVLPEEISLILEERISHDIQSNSVRYVDHSGQGTMAELDAGGEYKHHIFLGDDIRERYPELVGLYHGLLPLISSIVLGDVVTSPHRDSDINIKAYPPGGGTIGWHYDTNGITVLLYLSRNTEGALELEIPRKHPGSGEWKEERKILADHGSLLIMKGREVWHRSAATIEEHKYVVCMNYYMRNDTWRPSGFDEFVYDGEKAA